MKSDIPVRTETIPYDQKNSTPKDMAGDKFTTNAGTKSDNGKYTCRSHKFNGGKFSVKPLG